MEKSTTQSTSIAAERIVGGCGLTINLHFSNDITAAEKKLFATPMDIYKQIKSAEFITGGPYNKVWRWQSTSQQVYYIKIYHRRGHYLRRYFSRSRARGEWENLFYFQKQGFLIPELLVYGESSSYINYAGGFLVQRAVNNSKDLFYVAKHEDRWQDDVVWRRILLMQVVSYLRNMHKDNFVHKDFKWRNMLVKLNNTNKIYLIDCPSGRHQFCWRYRAGCRRDLRDFDKSAQRYLSQTERLRLYLAYRQIQKLTAKDKSIIRKIVTVNYGNNT